MKKILSLLASAIRRVALFIKSLFSRKSDVNEEKEVELVVENIVNTDKQYMFNNYGKDYIWFEECVLLKDFLDDENCDGTVDGVSTVFEVVTEKEKSFDTKVILCSHTKKASSVEVKDAFWVGDNALNDDSVTVSFKKAYENVMKANFVKPHSKKCVLRKELGPKPCNPQYIFGNVSAQLYVDAKTGDVRDKNPAYKAYAIN